MLCSCLQPSLVFAHLGNAAVQTVLSFHQIRKREVPAFVLLHEPSRVQALAGQTAQQTPYACSVPEYKVAQESATVLVARNCVVCNRK